jgi:superoxide dismutase, Fe-Mn family
MGGRHETFGPRVESRGTMQEPREISRREFLVSATTVGVAAAVAPGVAFASLKETTKKMETKLVAVPQAIPEKVYTSERVGISRKTHDEHLKLWQGYANQTNNIRKALVELDRDPAKANQIFSQMRALKVDYTFAYEGLINHNVYFDTMGGEGGPATGKVAELITQAYGSFEQWAADWKATGIAGRGWVYLAYDHEEKRVFNYIGDAQNTFPIWNHSLLLAMDVYEHAYFLDFGTARAKYIDAYMQCIDWVAVNKRGEAVHVV